MLQKVARPQSDEFPDAVRGYVKALEHEPDALAALEHQQAVIAAIGRLQPEQASYRYAEGKWSVKEVVGHVTDAERIFGYRLLRIARGDETPLAPFDENKYAAMSNADHRELHDLAKELASVRQSSIALVRSLDDRMLANRGHMQAGPITARGQIFVIAGHFEHHVHLLRERYGVDLR
ncbi:MAG TPA: DinB family protein [Vicinamibacterales bacterium]|nr:DinB family protein [Vicinamibacterales bacterium]